MNCLKCYGLKVSQISQSHLYKHVQKHLYNITWTVAIKIWPNTSSHNKQISWFTFLFLRFLILNKKRAKCVVLMYRISIFENQIAEEIQQKYLKITLIKQNFDDFTFRYRNTCGDIRLHPDTYNFSSELEILLAIMKILLSVISFAAESTSSTKGAFWINLQRPVSVTCKYSKY